MGAQDGQLSGYSMMDVNGDGDVDLLAQWLSERAGHRVRLRVARRGDGLRLLEMAQQKQIFLMVNPIIVRVIYSCFIFKPFNKTFRIGYRVS